MRNTNKFLNRTTRGKRGEKPSPLPVSGGERARRDDVLMEFNADWMSLDLARKRRERSLMYAHEDQWGDLIEDPETGRKITEGELIRSQGKVPLKNNLIAPTLRNIEGQFIQNMTQPLCSVRDSDEAKIGELMTLCLEHVHDVNARNLIDVKALTEVELGGFTAQRVEYGWNDAEKSNNVWVYNCEPDRLFFTANMEDERGWDLTRIGEIFDMPLNMVIAKFAKSEADKRFIEEEYGQKGTFNSLIGFGMQGEQMKGLDFFTPYDSNMCRVIFGWRLENRDAYFFHDTLKGEWGYVGINEKKLLDAENASRMKDALLHGVAQEDVLLIEYEFKVEQYWKYYYLTPWGHVLQEGRSPYWHGSHNYALVCYPLVRGKIYNFVEDFIDQQRSINRTMSLIDFIRSSSSKGLLVVNEDAIPGMTRQEIVDEYVRYNGVIFVRLKPGENVSNVLTQLQGQGAVAGDFELLQLQVKLINEISGVNSAMQGKPAASGTAASLYAQQVQNSSLNIKGLMESVQSFTRRRDYKIVQVMQQYYTPEQYMDLAGRDYIDESRIFDYKRVQNAKVDIKLIDSTSSPSYQVMMNDFLMQLFDKGALDIETMLENSTFQFKDKLLESLHRKRQEMQQGNAGAPMEIPDGNNALMQQALGGSQ